MSAELQAKAIVREVNDFQRTLSRISRTGEQNRLQILSRMQDLTKLRASLYKIATRAHRQWLVLLKEIPAMNRDNAERRKQWAH